MSLHRIKIDKIESNTANAMKILIDKEILIPLNATKEVYLNQIDTYKQLGSADKGRVVALCGNPF